MSAYIRPLLQCQRSVLFMVQNTSVYGNLNAIHFSTGDMHEDINIQVMSHSCFQCFYIKANTMSGLRKMYMRSVVRL